MRRERAGSFPGNVCACNGLAERRHIIVVGAQVHKSPIPQLLIAAIRSPGTMLTFAFSSWLRWRQESELLDEARRLALNLPSLLVYEGVSEKRGPKRDGYVPRVMWRMAS